MSDNVALAVLANAQGESVIAQWIKENIGGEIVKMERQGRWRPAWYVDLQIGGKVKQLYVRGARTHDFLPYRLDREFKIHQLLEKGGIKVSHVYGFVPDVPAIVMDKAPGRPNLRFADSEKDCESVRKQLVQQMAKMHALDPKPFREAGLHWPTNPHDTTMSFFDEIYAYYRRKKRMPDPRVEFIAAWLKRNAPPAKTEPRYTACDAGQFVYDGSNLTAILDLEMSVLGDPMQDLAALRSRTLQEYLGDIPSLYRLYEQETGAKIDLDVVRFHTVCFTGGGAIGGVLAMEYFKAAPTSGADYVEYLSWSQCSWKSTFEALAELKRLHLPELRIPEPVTTQAHDALLSMKLTVDSLDDSDPFSAYQQRTMLDTMAYLERVGAYGGYFEAEYIDGAAAILGKRPCDVPEADALLDTYVQQAGPEDDERLFRLLYTDITRRCFLLAIPTSRYLDGLLKPLAPIAD